MKYFEKQNKAAVSRTISLPEGEVWLYKLLFVDPITVNNIVGFVQQPHGLLASIPTDGLLAKDFATFRNHENIPAFKRLVASCFSHRTDHSSDWKEIRYMEKADVDALIDSMLPIFIAFSFSRPPRSVANYLRYMKTKIKSLDCSKWYEKSGKTIISSRFNFFDFEVLVNIWLFHPQIVRLFEKARLVYFIDYAKYSDVAFEILETFINILRSIPWPNNQLKDEVAVWVKKI